MMSSLTLTPLRLGGGNGDGASDAQGAAGGLVVQEFNARCVAGVGIGPGSAGCQRDCVGPCWRRRLAGSKNMRFLEHEQTQTRSRVK